MHMQWLILMSTEYAHVTAIIYLIAIIKDLLNIKLQTSNEWITLLPVNVNHNVATDSKSPTLQIKCQHVPENKDIELGNM